MRTPAEEAAIQRWKHESVLYHRAAYSKQYDQAAFMSRRSALIEKTQPKNTGALRSRGQDAEWAKQFDDGSSVKKKSSGVSASLSRRAAQAVQKYEDGSSLAGINGESNKRR